MRPEEAELAVASSFAITKMFAATESWLTGATVEMAVLVGSVVVVRDILGDALVVVVTRVEESEVEVTERVGVAVGPVLSVAVVLGLGEITVGFAGQKPGGVLHFKRPK